MRLTGEGLKLGRERRTSNPWRVLVYLLGIGGSVLLVRAVWVTRLVHPPFLPTSSPTPTSLLTAGEGRTQF